MKKAIFPIVGVGGTLAVILWIVAARHPENVPPPVPESPSRAADANAPGAFAGRGGVAAVTEANASADEEEETSGTPEERKADAEDAEEAAVDAFDGLTDKWMEPAEKGVAMADVEAFVVRFRKVPDARKEECLQRALNLVPDENVMLLAGILMDKSQPKELVELVFNDILNRDEDVKKPILQQIFKDKSHPCWADTAWILDVTGATSK